MDIKRKVEERDFRKPEFWDAKVEDYEFRGDGKLVRKDRWETGIVSIRFLVGVDGREYEIEDVIEAVKNISEDAKGWYAVTYDLPENNWKVSVKLEDGSILRNVQYKSKENIWIRNDAPVTEPVVMWKSTD